MGVHFIHSSYVYPPHTPLNCNLSLLWVQCLNINFQQWYISDHNSVLLVGLR